MASHPSTPPSSSTSSHTPSPDAIRRNFYVAFCGPSLSSHDRGRKRAPSDGSKVDYRDDKEYERLNKDGAERKSVIEAVPIRGKEDVDRNGLDTSRGVTSEEMMFTLSWSLEKD